jgi:2'-5' RNA ligase
MSTYALVHFPEIDKAKINEFRDAHDPYKDLIDVHITVVFPVRVAQQPLIWHIETVLSGWKPFRIRLKGLVLSFDRWLFLTVEDGNDQLVKLFEELYSGILAPHRRHDIEYIPHIGLGYFGTEEYNLSELTIAPLDEARYEEALGKAEAADLAFETQIERLALIEVDDQFTKTTMVKEFVL